ncbi:ATP-binding protein [Enterococcus saigonensis]|uniref:ATP-binding protein n=1 Tax=Enterococcus saigonensis TaxID=1805431 RepID=A0A679II93_9ENTE|nr:AAA family ATPase [Enterococcus saigonensis]BCA85722.1 ATP-binding protein [Enterococcus saigonensis]
MSMPYEVTNGRVFSRLEKQMIWQKPKTHQTSEIELRIASEIKNNWNDIEMKIMNILLEGDAGSGKTQLAKALSYDLQLPYTKVTCFADMDKSDVFGALLPVVATDDQTDGELLEAIYQTDSLNAVLELIAQHYSIDLGAAKLRLAELVERIDAHEQEAIHYKFYPSEIVRAVEKGYLLEIQEPTVIRDASVLVALNSALEPNGMLNLPTGIIRRHSDCVIVITTNRNYQGNRPLNESLRDRMQHAERMDLPEISVMVQRAVAKTSVTNLVLLTKMAEIIRLLDELAKVNTIKGVAGMRSYFYWVNTLKQGQDIFQTLYPKVIYKITTDPSEIALLEQGLNDSKLLVSLRQILLPDANQTLNEIKGSKISAEEADKRNIAEEAPSESVLVTNEPDEADLEKDTKKNKEEHQKNSPKEKITKDQPQVAEEHNAHDGLSESGKENLEGISEEQNVDIAAYEKSEKELRKDLNKAARIAMKGTIHEKEGLIIHRPQFTKEDITNAQILTQRVMPIVTRLTKKITDILENEQSEIFGKSKYSGTRFDASRVAYGDYRTFDKKNSPHEEPSLAVALRIDESGSMLKDERIASARLAALAVASFAEKVNIPLMIYGDTADLSQREKTSLYSYKEFSEDYSYLGARLVTMKPRQNNRDGVSLRLLSQKLAAEDATTKLLINISDGQPKALPDYTGAKAKVDIQAVMTEFERQGIIYLAAAIGDDKEAVKKIYGSERFLDISDLQTFPEDLIQLISRYL